MPFLYPGLYNSSYVPEPLELKFAENPGGYLNPYILAVMLTFLVAGTIASQAATYWRSKHFGDDSLILRLHVAVVLFLTTLKLLQVGAAGIMDFSVHYGDYLYLTHKDWLFRISVLLATIVSATVQVFFIKRVSKLSHHSFVFLTPTLLAWLGSIGSAIWVTIVFPEDWAKRSHSFVIAGRVAPALTLSCDLLVTGFAIYYLLDTNLRMPDESQVFRIIRIMIESAAPPCITAALNVVFDDQAAGGFVFLFVALTPMLQTFSMLYSLNSRKYFRERRTGIKSLNLSSGSRTPMSSRMNFATAPPYSAGGSTAVGSPFSVTIPMPQAESSKEPPRSAGYDKLPQLDSDHDLGGAGFADSPIHNYTTASPAAPTSATSQRPLLLASPSSSAGSPRTPPRPARSPMRLQYGDELRRQDRARSVETEGRQSGERMPPNASFVGRGVGTPPRPQGPRS